MTLGAGGVGDNKKKAEKYWRTEIRGEVSGLKALTSCLKDSSLTVESHGGCSQVSDSWTRTFLMLISGFYFNATKSGSPLKLHKRSSEGRVACACVCVYRQKVGIITYSQIA